MLPQNTPHRVVSFVESVGACRDLIANRFKNFSEDDLLGVGFFSTHLKDPIHQVGLELKAFPTFLVPHIRTQILEGNISIFEQDGVLFQVDDIEVTQFFPVRKWVMFGQDTCGFSASEIDVLLYLPDKNLVRVDSLEEYIHVFFRYIFAKVSALRPGAIFLLFDSDAFFDYISKLSHWGQKHGYLGFFKNLNKDLMENIEKEVVYYLAAECNHPEVVLMVPNSKSFSRVLTCAHDLRRAGSVSSQVMFGL